VATVLAVISNAMPNWSHGYVTIGAGLGHQLATANWSPWWLCYTELQGSVHGCTSFSSSMSLSVYNNNVNVAVPATGSWSSVLATRAFSILLILVGGGGFIFATVSFFKTLSIKQELYITTMAFIAAFFGFLATCVWAGYSNAGLVEFGSSYALLVVSWLLFLAAGIVGNWERFDGVPESAKRFISLIVSFLVLLGSVVATVLPNWMHEQFVFSSSAFQILTGQFKATLGLFKVCFHYTKDGVSETNFCASYASNITVPNIPEPGFNLTVPFSASQLTEFRAVDAFALLTVITAAIAFVSVAVGFWKRDDTGPIARWRVWLVSITGFWSFLTMVLVADLFRQYQPYYVEYGGGFVLEILVWVVAWAWVFATKTKGTPPAVTAAGGFGYVVATGDTGHYQDSDRF